jgi:hypothetical protein
MLHRDSTIQKCFRVRRFPVPCQPSGRCVILSGRPFVTVSSVRTTYHTVWTPDRPSIIRSDDVHFLPDHPLCREGSIQLASVRRVSPQGKNRNSNTPVRTSDSLGPDVRSSKKEIGDSTSTARTAAYHGSDPRTLVMEIAC